MDAKYNRQLTLVCPTCGGTQFADEVGAGADEMVQCVSCQRKLTKDELIRENAENISENVKEIGQKVRDDVTNELRKTFSGFKTLKIR